MSERTIWQFGLQYICIEDGSPATDAERTEFLERHALAKKAGEENTKLAEEADRKWHEKYDPIMKSFFGYEEIDEEDYEDTSWMCHSDDDLVYRLATTIFDGIPSSEIPNYDYYDTEMVRGSEVVASIKKTFPEYWEEAVQCYLERNHDT